MVRLVVEIVDGRNVGAIMTVDDVTDIQKNQKAAAWADVARRIAHEIKNPLTPIQLSAERLQRKYAGQIQDDPENFAMCTHTIIKHVEDIGRMVSEFSDFARLPEPVMRRGDLATIIEETMLLHRQAHRGIEYVFEREEEGGALEFEFDHQQMRQVFNNVLKNAAESIEDAGLIEPARIVVRASILDDGRIAVLVQDSGSGLPAHLDAAQMLEPYVTNKEQGTGLGLAIVKKIMDDHGAELLFDTPYGLSAVPDLTGACVVLIFKTGIQGGD